MVHSALQVLLAWCTPPPKPCEVHDLLRVLVATYHTLKVLLQLPTSMHRHPRIRVPYFDTSMQEACGATLVRHQSSYLGAGATASGP